MARRVCIENPNQLFLFSELVRVPADKPGQVVFELREVRVRQGLTPKEFGAAMRQVCGREFSARCVMDWIQSGVVPSEMVFQARKNSPYFLDVRAIEHVRRRFQNA